MSVVTNKAINDYLSKQGISHSVQGYKYLMVGLRAVLDNKVNRSSIRAIYEYVAAADDIPPSQVERAIRHAVRRAVDPVPNKEFLLRAADELALAADANAFIFESAKPKNR